MPHPRWGEAGVAFVVLTRGAEVDPDDLRTWCRERLAAYKVPVRVLVVDELPRNATGKVLKAPLRRPGPPRRADRLPDRRGRDRRLHGPGVGDARGLRRGRLGGGAAGARHPGTG